MHLSRNARRTGWAPTIASRLVTATVATSTTAHLGRARYPFRPGRRSIGHRHRAARVLSRARDPQPAVVRLRGPQRTRDDSDIDLLVEFEPGRTPGLLGVAKLELELRELLGREVDLRTVGDLSPYFRDDVVAAARVLYDAA
jgi:predicted nucleotidyltransferase